MADFLGGLQARRFHLLAVLLVSQAAGLVLVVTVVSLRGEPPPGAGYLALGALSGLAGVCGLAAFYRGLAVGAMGVVAPISATSAIVPLAFGLATGEHPSGMQTAGVAVAIAGVVLASLEPAEEAVGRRPSGRVASGAGLALVSAAGFGWFFVAIDAASEGDALWATLANRSASVSLLLLAVIAARPSIAVGRAGVRALAAVGCLDISANLLFALASTQGLVSVVAVLGSLYPVTVVVLARVVLRERIRPVQRAGAGVALAGVALISAG